MVDCGVNEGRRVPAFTARSAFFKWSLLVTFFNKLGTKKISIDLVFEDGHNGIHFVV